MQPTRGFQRRALAAALAAIYSSVSLPALANPSGAQVVNGQAVLQTQGNRLTVTNTPGTIINWQSFSIGAGETTFFQQQNAASAVLNRVQAQNPSLKSQIDGTLGSNGRVFLINPNGVVFGAGSVIDTQGFVASTLSMNDDDFKNGRLRFARQGVAADIQAQGRISSGSGDVYLVAPHIGVDGNAVISSQGGNVVLAAGEMVEITGRNLNDITFTVQNNGNQVLNLGNLSGGAVGVFAGTLTHSGVIQAQTLSRDGGKLVLKAQGNVMLGAGSTSSADGQSLGGQVQISSQTGNVVVDTGATVSARALAGAGPLALPRAGSVLVTAADGLVAIERNAQVDVSGVLGGSVLIQSDRLLQEGAVRADGQGGVGGTVTLQASSRVVQTASALVSATGTQRGGTITLSVDPAADGTGHLFSSATIDASASSGIGGKVTVSGRELVFAGAHILANGDAGGGTVRLGGGRAGADASMPNAQNVVVTASSSVQASARLDGDGGTAITWSDGSTRFAGVVEARGGANSGNGGFIEVSGKQETQFGGTPNASAPHGRAGTFLLDPKFILIQAPVITSGSTVELLDPNPGTGDLFGQNLQRFLNDTRILIRKPNDDLGGANAGAVYLFDGVTGALLSHLRGGTAGDQIGGDYQDLIFGGTKLALLSPNWTNGGAANAGAVTWYDASVGLSGLVSASNSLVGSNTSDFVGNSTLANMGGGKYYLPSPNWNGSRAAVTFVDIAAPVVGAIGATNSLVGSLANDRVGGGSISDLGGAYVLIISPNWDSDRGAVTWFSKTSGLTGQINSTNSLVGSTPGDLVGWSDYATLAGGGLAIFSPFWNNGGSAPSAGAITWATFNTPKVGVVSAGNSLVGTQASDGVGNNYIDNLGFVGGPQKYFVHTTEWNGRAGAVTLIDTNAPPVGPVSALNSLVGANPNDQIGSGGVHPLNNGNYVVISSNAQIGGNAAAGAVTWASGAGGPTSVGVVDASNSLVGTSANDRVGSGTLVDLNSGNYVIGSPSWGGGRGAVTFASGTTQIIGSPDSVGTVGGNSVYGNTNTSAISSADIRSLGNGNFIVFSPNHGLIPGAALGAVTIGDGNTGFLGGVTAPVSNLNSIVGTQAGDQVGINPSPNFFDQGSYYILRTPSLHGSTILDTNAGGVTFLTGVPVAGDIKTLNGVNANGIFGASAGDNVGSNIVLLNSGNFVVGSSTWSNPLGPFNGAGAITFGDSTSGFLSSGRTAGLINSSNSLVGTSALDQLGSGNVLPLPNGNYIVKSQLYNTAGGAVTFGDGYNAITGTIAATINGNSIFGAPGDQIGSGGIQFLDYYSGGSNFGNFVVLSPNALGTRGAITFGLQSTGFATNAGPVSSSTSLVGTSIGDQVGNGGIQPIDPFNPSQSSYLIVSPTFNSGGGAVTWANGSAPITGTIDGATSGGNSIYGAPGDGIGSGGISTLNNYHFVVLSPDATNGSAANAGAVTFGRYDTGFAVPGLVSPSNSLMGTNSGDRIGSGGIEALYNFADFTQSNYLILSPQYNSSGGAVTWASGTLDIRGEIASEIHGNSVFGAPGDIVGSSGVAINFSNYNFVVLSPSALSGAGAATFGLQASGFASPGPVSSSNSLVGSSSTDNISNNGVQFLANDLYAVRSPNWNFNAGAISWGNSTTGLVGVVGASNSLIGANAGDGVGLSSINSFGAGSYIRTLGWNGNRSAVTYIDTTNPVKGMVSSSNSLVGSTPGDNLGSDDIDFLGNNKIAVLSRFWDNGAAVNAGAVTIVDATAPLSGFTGVVSGANSFVGSMTNDFVGLGGVSQVSGGLWAVRSSSWHNGAAANAGAVTWVDTLAAGPFAGPVSTSNSLVGSNTNDFVGSGTSFTQGDGYLLVRNGNWSSNRGAVTWMTAAAPLTGAISSANSLVGANSNDFIGNGGILANSSFYLANGDYVVVSPNFASGSGAYTIGSAAGGITGIVSGNNSQVGLGAPFPTFVNDRSRILAKNQNANSQGFANGGRVCLYAGGAGCPSSLALGSNLYGDNAAASVTITPSQIIAILNTGTNVTLQASSDITLDALSDIVANNPGGIAGSLTLQAGRSVLLNSNITTDEGNLTVIANDRVANGVQALHRDAGTAAITMANGTMINAGAGSVDFQLRDGIGHSGAATANGVITLRSITANNLSVQTDAGTIQLGDPGATSPTLIKLTGDAYLSSPTMVLVAGGSAGAQAELSADGQIQVKAPILEMSSGGSFARLVNPTGFYKIILGDPLALPPVVNDCPTCLVVSDYEITGQNSDLINIETVVTAPILSLNPIPDWKLPIGSPIPPKLGPKGDLVVDTDETCR